MAGELESLDTDEPLKQRLERHRFDRMIMLSDGVFAIAITLLALELRPPEHWSGSWSSLLEERWRAMLGFVIGFVIVGAFWFAHREIFARLRRIDMPATLLGLLILLLVTLAPAVASLLAENGPGKAMPAYFSLITAISASQAMLWAWASFPGKLVDRAISSRARLILLLRFAIPGIVGACATLAWGTPSSSLSTLLLIVIVPIVVVVRRASAKS